MALSHGRLRAAFLTACLAACLAAMGPGAPGAALARGGATEVDVELVIAVDISYSMDEEEQRLQRRGYVEALRSAEFQEAVRAGVHGKVAILYLEWAGASDQRVVVDWTLIDGPERAHALADKLAEAPTRRARRTSISGALEASLAAFERNGFNGLRRVIDVSGDGPNNEGRLVTSARDAVLAEGVVINGLPLVLNRPNYGWGDIQDLDVYYQDCVIGGQGAFVLPIRDRAQFVEATRTKLVMEVALGPVPAPAPAVGFAQARVPRVSCAIGERMWNDRWGN
ncbi:MAG: DUF1194 domain-containing protein [Rhizobiales bacterium]|nr:DUF1194 domain-containing protein [Hyphomicrobiales bacterium]